MAKECPKCKVLKDRAEFIDDKGIERKICRRCSVVRRLWYQDNQVRLNKYKRQRFHRMMGRRRRPLCEECGKYPVYPDRRKCWRCSRSKKARRRAKRA